MKRVGFVYDDVFLSHDMPPGHPESADRLVAVLDALKRSPHWPRLVQLKPRRATRDEILLAHSPAHYDRVSTFTGYYDPDTYLSPRTFEASLFAAGAGLEAVDAVKGGKIARAFCAVRPPGHHAERDRAMGFCIFNNVAVAARYAQQRGFGKIFIIDFDVHHGNGTQHIFSEDAGVFYFSTHQYPHYPGTGGDHERGTGAGAGSTCNIPMRHGAGDRDYMAAYQDILPGLMRDFVPDLVLVSAGYDLHADDPLAGIRVTDEGIRQIVDSILASARDVPCIFCLEGGYNLRSLSEGVVITITELLSQE